MDSLFPSGFVNATNYTHVTPLGVALVCVVLLVLFYFLLVKGKFVPVVSEEKKEPFGIQTGMGLRWQQQDTVGVGAGFHSAYEPPVSWGEAGGRELNDYQQVSARDERALALQGEGVDTSKTRSGPAGFSGSDAELLARAQGYGR